MPTLFQIINRLAGKIDQQARYAEPMEKRYSNEHIPPFLAKEYAEVYPGLVIASADGRVTDSVVSGSLHSMLDTPKTGTAAIVVDAFTERTVVNGFVSEDQAATKLLNEAWEDNDLDLMHREGHREAFIGARSFASAARETGGTRAVVGIDHCSQAAAIRSQAPPYNILYYMKTWTDEWTGDKVGMLRIPGQDFDLTYNESPELDPEGSGERSRWIPSSEPTPTGLIGVPVEELTPNSRLLKDPVSAIDPIVSLIDIVDLVEGLLVFAGHFGAVPIRYATGLDVPRDPKDPTKPLLGPDGKPAIGFKPRADHFWANSNKDAKFGQLEPAGLASFVAWAEHASSRVRAKTALASTYFSMDLKSHMSAELLKTDEAPMTRRVRGYGEKGALNRSWRRMGQWILAIESPGNQARVRPRWEDPETRIDSQIVDQFSKLVSSGMGLETTAKQLLDWDPEAIEQAVSEYNDLQNQGTDDPFSLLDPTTRSTLKALPSVNSNAAAGQ